MVSKGEKDLIMYIPIFITRIISLFYTNQTGGRGGGGARWPSGLGRWL